MSEEMKEQEGKVVTKQIEASIGDITMACAMELIGALPNETTLDSDKIAEVREGIKGHAKASKQPIGKVAATLLAREVGTMRKLIGMRAIDPSLQEDRTALLKSLEFSQELVEAAMGSVTLDNHDESDEQLAAQIKEVFNLGDGPGTPTGITKNYVQSMIGAAVAEASGWIGIFTRVLDDEPTMREQFIATVAKAVTAEAPDGFFSSVLKNENALLFLWAYYISAFKAGLFMGWRSHELAVLESSVPSMDKEVK